MCRRRHIRLHYIEEVKQIDLYGIFLNKKEFQQIAILLRHPREPRGIPPARQLTGDTRIFCYSVYSVCLIKELMPLMHWATSRSYGDKPTYFWGPSTCV